MDQFEAFILAGGASRRMGSDKSQLLIGDESFVQRISNTLLQVATSVTIVGHEIVDPRLLVAQDVYEKWGALGGLHGALHACKSEWSFVVACDLPFVTSTLIEYLASQRSDSDAVVPIQPDNRPQPLCAFYRTTVCLDRASELIERDMRRPLDLLESVNTRWIPFSDLEYLEHSEKFFVNINTPEDYYEVTRQAGPIAQDDASQQHRS